MFDWDYKKEHLGTVARDAVFQFCQHKSGKTLGEIYNFNAVSETVRRMREFAATIKSGQRTGSYELEHAYLEVFRKVFDIDTKLERDKHLRFETDLPAGLELIAEQIENAKNSRDKAQIKQARETCYLISVAAMHNSRCGRYGLVA
jgi:hypothetical protein